MRLGFALPQIGPLAGPDALVAVATGAERLGYDSLWVLERTLAPVEPRVPYGGRTMPEALRTVLDPLGCLGFAAAVTSRVTLGTSVLNLPWYNPVLLARQLTTLDVLSNGRLAVGLGIGWAPEEYEAAGLPFEGRGARFEEVLAALKAIWTQNPVELAGGRFSVPRSWIGPKPVQKPHPPILVAGFTPAALERVGRLGDAWNPANVPPVRMAEMFADVQAAAARAGRDPRELSLVVRANSQVEDGGIDADRAPFAGTADQIAGDVVACRDIGASELLFDVNMDPGVTSLQDVLERMERLFDASRRALGDPA